MERDCQKIFAGADQSFTLTFTSTKACGDNSFGQLGISDRSHQIQLATLNLPSGIKQISTWEQGSLVLLHSGEVLESSENCFAKVDRL
jgi:alpha-tubulin suppressor-like RCC1 family protein